MANDIKPGINFLKVFEEEAQLVFIIFLFIVSVKEDLLKENNINFY